MRTVVAKPPDHLVRWHLGETAYRDPAVTFPLRLRSRQNGFGGHWRHSAGLNRKERQAAALVCHRPLLEYRAALADESVPAVVVVITRIAPRELDDDNLRTAAKSLRDGITDALGLTSDRDRRLRWEYSQEKGRPNEYSVRITVLGRNRVSQPELPTVGPISETNLTGAE